MDPSTDTRSFADLIAGSGISSTRASPRTFLRRFASAAGRAASQQPDRDRGRWTTPRSTDLEDASVSGPFHVKRSRFLTASILLYSPLLGLYTKH